MYTDTDSATLRFPLPAHMVGPKIGQMKPEAAVAELCIVRNKFYAYVTTTGKVVMKAAGLPKGALTIEQFRDLVTPAPTGQRAKEIEIPSTVIV